MKVSIYILNHNYARYLKEAVESVLVQGYDDVEVILIDDGSNDDSIALIENNYGNNERVAINRNIESQGLIKCCNQALNIASGDLILRLDADDVLAADAITTLVQFYTRQKALCPQLIAVFGDYIEIDQTGHAIKQIKKQSKPLGDSDFLVPIHGACTLIDAHWLRAIGGYDEEFSRQDGFYIWAQAAALGKKILGCEQVIFQYRKHQLSLSAAWSKILDQRNLIAEKIVTKQLDGFTYDIVLPIRAADVIDDVSALAQICILLKQRFTRPKNIKTIYVISSSEIIYGVVKEYLGDFNVVFRHRPEESEAAEVTLRQSLRDIDIYESSDNESTFALIMSVAATLVSPKDVALLVNQAVIFQGFQSFIIGRIIRGDIYQPLEGGLGELSESNKFTNEGHCFIERTPGVVLVKANAWSGFVSEDELSVGLAESL